MKQIYFFLILLFWSFNSFSQSATHLNFDGQNDFVSLTNQIVLPNEFTIEAWIKTTVDGSILSGSDATLNQDFVFGIDGAKLRFQMNSNSVVLSFTSYPILIADNNWHHVALTKNSSGLFTMYVDGVMTTPQNSPSVPVIFSQIGTSMSLPNFNGSLDELRVWNVARTVAEINGAKDSELLCSESGLVACYQFNKGINVSENTILTSLTDFTANSNNGTLTNFALTGTSSNWSLGSPVNSLLSPPTVVSPIEYVQNDTALALTGTTGFNGVSLLWYTDAIGGIGSSTLIPSTTSLGLISYYVSSVNANGCESDRTQLVVNIIDLSPATHLNFDGTNDYVTAGNILPSSYTKEAMIFLTASSSTNNIISGSNSFGQHAFWVPNMILSAGHNNTWGSVQDAVNLALNTWYHVAVSYDIATQTLRLYKNGVLISTAINIPAPINGNEVLIGAYDNGNLFNGNIDEVRIWNKVLTATDIMNHMNCELQSTETGLVAYYKFNQGSNGADNTSVTTVADSSGNANNGALTNFARTGTTSNFLSGSPITTGNTCTTLTLSNSNFEIANNIKMYPNPTNNIVTVDVNNLTNAKLQVLDITGKILRNQVLNTSSNTVDVQQLPSGMYLFKVSSNEGTATSKIVKN